MRIILILLFLLFPMTSSAFSPRLVTEESVVILNPDVAQVFYDTLVGEARAYRMTRDDTWTLDLNLLVPASLNPSGKFDAVVVNESSGTVASILEAGSTPWQAYYDPLGASHYFRGPQLHQELPAGAYRIVITSDGNIGRYALSIGEIEKFSVTEIVNTVLLLPELRKNYFEVSPSTLIASPVMAVYAILIMLIGALFGVYLRRYPPQMRFLRSNTRQQYKIKNIDVIGRSLRIFIALILFAFAIFTTWNPLLFALSGLSLYQALSGWCVFFAFLGRSSCPIENN